MKNTKKIALILFSIFSLLGVTCAYALTIGAPQKAFKTYFKEEIANFEKEYKEGFHLGFMRSCIKRNGNKLGEAYCGCIFDGLIEKKVYTMKIQDFFEDINPSKSINFYNSEEGQTLTRKCLPLKSEDWINN
mgnify:CR=1 FL=1